MEKREAKLYPTELGFLVTDLLVEHFQDIMNVEYTAAMEDELDQIEEGKDNLLNTLNQFWKKFKKDLDTAAKDEDRAAWRTSRARRSRPTRSATSAARRWSSSGAATATSSPAPVIPSARTRARWRAARETAPEIHEDVAKEVCPNDGQPMVLKKGRFGPFLACTNYPDCKITKRLVRGEGGKLQVEALAPIDEKCPECGKDLMWRRGRFGAFIACSDYPNCKYIKKKEAKEIGLPCPECGEGQVVERKGRWGRSFYGCRRYPECKFTAYHRPVAEPCPECGRAYLLEKETKKEGKVIFCGNEACHYRREAA